MNFYHILKTEISSVRNMKISGANTEHYVALNTLFQRDEDATANC